MTLIRRRLLALTTLTAATFSVAASCGSDPYTLTATGPFVVPLPTTSPPSLERVAVIVTIASHSSDDLQINPTDFALRDAAHRLYTADAAVTTGDFNTVGRTPDIRGTLPLPVIMLRKDDVLSGYVLFNVPAGVRPVELIWRQTDSDTAVPLTGGQA